MHWWWISFADPTLPQGSTFLGGAVVGPAAGVMPALSLARAMGCNPGGEVYAERLTPEELETVPEQYRGRLLNKADIEDLSRAMGGPGIAERM